MYKANLVVFSLLFSVCLFAKNSTDTDNIKGDNKIELEQIADSLNNAAKSDNHINIIGNTETYNNLVKQYDKIYTTNWKLYIGKVQRIDNTNIYFQYPLNDETSEIKRDNISQIIYASGKHEVFAMPNEIEDDNLTIDTRAKLAEKKEWQDVLVADSSEVVNGLSKLGAISANYEADKLNANTKFLEKNVLIILRRKAANMNGDYIVITKKNVRRSYGELPFITMKAEVYGSENALSANEN